MEPLIIVQRATVVMECAALIIMNYGVSFLEFFMKTFYNI